MNVYCNTLSVLLLPPILFMSLSLSVSASVYVCADTCVCVMNIRRQRRLCILKRTCGGSLRKVRETPQKTPLTSQSTNSEINSGLNHKKTGRGTNSFTVVPVSSMILRRMRVVRMVQCLLRSYLRIIAFSPMTSSSLCFCTDTLYTIRGRAERIKYQHVFWCLPETP